MPQTRKLMKHTGDIHPPEVEYDLEDRDDEDAPARDAALLADAPPGRISMPATMELPAAQPMERSFEEDARAQVRRKPFAALAAAFALGFVLVKLFR